MPLTPNDNHVKKRRHISTSAIKYRPSYMDVPV